MALGEIVETLIPTHLQSCCQLCVNGKICSPAVLIKTLGPGPCVRVLLNPLRGGAPSLSNSSFVCEPGENFNKKLLVPQQVADKLVAMGWLVPVASEGIAVQHFAWDLEHCNKVNLQQSALLNVLPDGKQKRLLQNKWIDPKCPNNSLLEPDHSSSLPSASSSRDKHEPDKVQKIDDSTCSDLPKDQKPPGDNMVSQVSQPEQGVGIDRMFLLNAAKGHSLSKEDRLKLGQHARSLSVLQKEAGKKKTNAVLANECLSAIEASKTVAKNVSQPPPLQADATDCKGDRDAKQPRGIKRAFQSESKPSKR